MLLRHQAPRSVAAGRLAAGVLLGAAAAALLWATSEGKAGPWPLLLAVPPFVAAWIWDSKLLRRTPLDVALLVFASTAVLGVWAAYDRALALDKLWLLAGALLLFYALTLQDMRILWRAAIVLALLGMGIAAYFLLTHDWQAYPVKFTVVNRLVQWWAGVRPALAPGQLHPNVAGSLLAMLLPFQLMWAIHSQLEKRRGRFAAVVSGMILTTLALLLTASRGAVLAGIAGGGVAILLFLARANGPNTKRLLPLLWGALLLLPLLLTMTWASGAGADGVAFLDRMPGPARAGHRALLAAETRQLISDFPFTGGGLAAFPGLYSQYILRIPYPFLPNGHNLFLDVALEQGIFGIAAFLLIVAVTFWLLLLRESENHKGQQGPYQKSALQLAATASFVTLLLHGLVEDTVYGSSALPLLFVAPAFAVALVSPTTERKPAPANRSRAAHVAIAAIIILAALGALLTPVVRATAHANLGAVQMARIQLAGWPTGEWATGSKTSLMGAAESHFQRALHLNPQQPTARYRLGSLAMLRGDYAEAVSHLEIAREQVPGHRGIRKALGYSYVWSGATNRGAALLATVEDSQQELRVYSGWWRRQGRPDLALKANQALEHLEQYQP